MKYFNLALVVLFYELSLSSIASAKVGVPLLPSLLSDPTLVYNDGSPWSPTDFSDQGEALGLDGETFLVPKNLEKATLFWTKIYTEFTTHQGVIHDVQNLGVIYEKVDFSEINSNDSLTLKQKAKAREDLVEDRKKEILASLTRVAAQDSSLELSDLDRAVQILWKEEGGVAAMKEAADMGRIRFQLGQKDRVQEAIYLSGRYLPMMEQTFKKHGLPIELTRLVFVESSFNVLARSKVGASGLWQIMPGSARGKLKMNSVVDLRNHPQEATELAAKMLKFNYEMLGAWPLAITGYNHGPYGVKRMVDKNKTTDLGELIETGEGRRFGFASRNFYSSFLAILEVEKKANEYFPGIRQAEALQVEEPKIEKPVFFSDLVKAFKGDRDLAQLYNPHLQPLVYQNKLTITSKSRVVVPAHIQSDVEKVLARVKARADKVSRAENKKLAPKKKARRVVSAQTDDAKTYRVNRGDTLYQISRQFGVSMKSILAANDIKKPGNIKAGQILVLP